VTSIAFNPGIPASQIVRIGIDEPFSIPFSVTKTKACSGAPTFAISPLLGFVSITQSGDSGTIVISGSVPSNDGIYPLVLTAT